MKLKTITEHNWDGPAGKNKWSGAADTIEDAVRDLEEYQKTKQIVNTIRDNDPNKEKVFQTFRAIKKVMMMNLKKFPELKDAAKKAGI